MRKGKRLFFGLFSYSSLFFHPSSFCDNDTDDRRSFRHSYEYDQMDHNSIKLIKRISLAPESRTELLVFDMRTYSYCPTNSPFSLPHKTRNKL